MSWRRCSVEGKRLFLRFKAPFAAFRPFQSGSYRSTTPVPSPSAVYGLLLNLAAIEQRDEIEAPVTKIRLGLPDMKIAIGLPEASGNPSRSMQPRSELALLTQQLHGYPVGSSGQELAEKTYGSKFWIAPVTREVLVDLDFIVGVEADAGFVQRIVAGLNGELEVPRYGLPFAGDNNFLFDRIDPIDPPKLARWYERLARGSRPRRELCRLTVWIDRADNSRTDIGLFAPSDFVREPPESAWIPLPG
ncbi:MAG: type I-MYXAN CRISPR-associated protein Cas5/Cmx5/DevS [Cyanobacteria bacterium SID2]|nr:type I-MYXAN CRISPR-associated protein Cas5/Cmx5/DevS [Cyanobacteria bacterium SID2]MBP0004967.1 type I-MYXAN CRISPR-associated protein Cas5/Cmx5/DevS [Cyanobacteria bacterium SBC]